MKKFSLYFSLLASTAAFSQEEVISFERKNLGENINSVYKEMAPRISADGKTLFFVREGHPKNKNHQDVWHSEMGEDGNWKPAVRSDQKINELEANCVWSVNADGNTVMIRGAFVNGSFVGRGFSLTRMTKDGWTKPQYIDIEGLSEMNHGDNDGAYLSTDGNAIIFTMCEKQNCHLYDLYVSTKRENGSFTRPRKIAGNVNSDYNEFAPFLASDNKTLYFSSDKPGGLGMTDIYKTERTDTTWTNWSEPENVGAPINTTQKDGYYVSDAKNEYAYMVSDMNSIGSADIVRIKLKKQQMAKPVALYDGQVFDAKTKKQIDATIEYHVYPTDSDKGLVHTDHETGQYKIVFPYGEDYTILVHAKGYVSDFDTISLKKEGEYSEIKRDYYLTPIEVGQKVVLQHIYFETGKYDLLPESYYELDKVVKLMTENDGMSIELGGHTDDKGNDDNNQKLSQNRATAVVAYLSSKGINISRLTAVGYGEKMPIMPNDTDENRQKNRRVEFTIKKM